MVNSFAPLNALSAIISSFASIVTVVHLGAAKTGSTVGIASSPTSFFIVIAVRFLHLGIRFLRSSHCGIVKAPLTNVNSVISSNFATSCGSKPAFLSASSSPSPFPVCVPFTESTSLIALNVAFTVTSLAGIWNVSPVIGTSVAPSV